MARVRTFIAIDVSDEIRAAGERVIDALRRSTAGVRWVRPENIHLTLKFLGDVDERELHDVCRGAGQAAQESPPFSVNCRSIGAFPNASRPSTIWMGIDDDQGRLAALQEHLEGSLATLGFPTERRKFRGHITLGRVRSGRGTNRELQQFIETHVETGFGSLDVHKLTIYRSDLDRGGPNYTVVARCPLGSVP